jgi:hypothetical protein
MADGTTKAIEDVQPGDRVLAFDKKHALGTPLRARQVNAVKSFENKEIIQINGMIKASPDHLLPLAENGKHSAVGDLKVGDSILDRDGKPVLIDKIEHLQSEDVYNFEVDEDFTYVANGIRSNNMVFTLKSQQMLIDRGELLGPAFEGGKKN